MAYRVIYLLYTQEEKKELDMKSNLFSSFDPTGKENLKFIGDLHKVLQLNREIQDSFFKALPELIQATNTSMRKKIARQLNKKTGLDRIEIQRTYNLCAFFIGNLDDEELNIQDDTAESWAEDLVSYNVLNENEIKDFTYFASKLRSIYDTKISIISREKSFQVGVVPTLMGFATTVELRGVFKNVYSPNIPVSEYSPALYSVTPIISVSISVNKGESTNFVFQGTPTEIDTMICGLQVAVKEAEILQKSCNLV